MAKRDKDLYEAIRAKGVRKSVAKAVSEVTGRGRSGGKGAEKALRKAASDLRAVVADLEDRASGGPSKRKATATKAARTRKQKAAKRSVAAKKGARTRARGR